MVAASTAMPARIAKCHALQVAQEPGGLWADGQAPQVFIDQVRKPRHHPMQRGHWLFGRGGRGGIRRSRFGCTPDDRRRETRAILSHRRKTSCLIPVGRW
jgi:hypothetical protein